MKIEFDMGYLLSIIVLVLIIFGMYQIGHYNGESDTKLSRITYIQQNNTQLSDIIVNVDASKTDCIKVNGQIVGECDIT